MEIMQIMSNARRKTVVFKPESGKTQARSFPAGTPREDIAAALEENIEQKKTRKRRKSEDDQS